MNNTVFLLLRACLNSLLHSAQHFANRDIIFHSQYIPPMRSNARMANCW